MLALGHAKQAIVEYQAALDVEPSARAHRGLGLAYETLSAHTRARQHLEAAVEARPHDIEARVALARVHTHFGQYERARRELLAALEVDPNDSSAVLFFAVYAESRSDLERALSLLDALRERHSRSGEAVTRAAQAVLADLLERLQQSGAAELRETARYAPLDSPRLTIELARASQGRHNFRLSEQLLGPLVERYPGELDAWQLLAAAHLELGRYGAAREAMSHLQPRASDPEVRLLEARLGLARGPGSAKERELRALIAQVPDEQEHQRARIRRFLARALTAQERLEEAQRELELLVDDRPEDVEGRLALAELHLTRRRGVEAARVLEGLPEQHGHLARARELIGRAELESGDIAGAESAFRQLAELAPHAPDASYWLAVALDRRGEAEQARRLLEANLTRFPTHVRSMLELAGVLERTQGSAAAKSFVLHHADQQSASPELAHAEAEWLLAHGDTDRGLAAHRRALALDPGYFPSARELATFYSKRGKLDLAGAVLEGALSHAPDDLDLLLLAARLSAHGGQYREALRYCERALALEPDHPLVLAVLAEVHAEGFRDLRRASEVASAAQASAPDHPDVLDALGWVEQLRGQPTRALPYLERAARADPDNPRILYHLGAALLGAGQTEASREKLARVLGLDPEFPTANEIRSLLAARSR